jgi:hypothetical protein
LVKVTCATIDIGCHVAAYFDPLLTWWGGIGAFVKAWWWVAYGAVCLIVGAHLGKVRAYGIVTAGLVAIALRYWPQKGDEPAYETGEPEPPPKPKKRKTIFGN